MKRFRILLGIAMVLVFGLSLAARQAELNTPINKVLSGELVTVNAMAKVITVKTPEGQDMTFHYNDDTKIVNPDKNSQGLAGKTGARLLVTYHEEKGINLATVIDITE